MITDETNPLDFQKSQLSDHSHIKGWGVDANKENDPTYPIKNRKNLEHKGYKWDRPAQQDVNIEVLKSVERPNITATFGTSVPPAGLSGRLRRFAFKYSESSYGRWLPLILADRVGALEGIADDIKKGHFPNMIAERGWIAEWKYNRNSLVKKVVAGVMVTAAVVSLLRYRNKRRRRSVH